MVVISGSWVKNVATYPAPTVEINNEIISNTNNNMCAKAVLISRPNSHPFQERTLTLDQPIKIGRSVARAKAIATNAIFDCKVLSRHHALLWYENGKFFLQDTKSSNGTFVNNTRLSSSDSEPHEVSSGDIVQFGVDVVENNPQVTHRCIVATLKLYLPDGKEAKASPSITESNRLGLVPLDELYRLNQIIQEASQREKCLETKLDHLLRVVDEARKSADESWQAYIDEEKLLSRVATLENQLQQAVQNIDEDKLKEELARLEEEKTQYQLTAKKTLCKLHAERLQAVALATEQERARISTEQEAQLIKEQLAQVQRELEEVAQKLTDEKRKSEEEKLLNEIKQQELQCKLFEEKQLVKELKSKVEEYYVNMEKLPQEKGEETEKGDFPSKENGKNKEDILAELENCDNNKHNIEKAYIDINTNNTNDNIDLMVAPINQENNSEKTALAVEERNAVNEDLSETKLSTAMLEGENNKNLVAIQDVKSDNDSDTSTSTVNHVQEPYFANGFELEKNDVKDVVNDNVDSKTLKYQLLSVQKQMSKRVKDLEEEVMYHSSRAEKLTSELKKLQSEYKLVQEAWESKRIENNKLLETITELQEQLMVTFNKLNNMEKAKEEKRQELASKSEKTEVQVLGSEKPEVQVLSSEKPEENMSISEETEQEFKSEKTEVMVSPEILAGLEEELVLLKERYAELIEANLVLSKNYGSLEVQYREMCNSSYNKMFFYVAPLVLMVIYLLFTSIFS